MAEVALPSSLDYQRPIPYLPECNTYSQAINPVNGNEFQASSTIILDLPQRGFLDPKSLHFRYQLEITSSTNVPQMPATPAYTPFVRLEEYAGSVMLGSCNQYNQVAGFLIMNTQYGVSFKYGVQSSLGYLNNTGTDVAMEKMDGRTLSASTGETISLSAPLIGSLFHNAEKHIPLFAMPQLRIQLVVDSISNMFSVNSANVSAIKIKNFELCFSIADFGPAIESSIRSSGQKLFLKTLGYSNNATRLASSSNGSQSLVFNQRYKSVRSAFVLFAGTESHSVNKWGDAFDPTSSNGDIQLFVGGVAYPQRPLSFVNNKAGILSELRRCVGVLSDRANDMAINATEFSRAGNTTTTTDVPAKCIIGIDLEKMETKGTFLAGTSTESSPITVQLNTSTATSVAYNVNCILAYDAVIVLDNMSGQAMIQI